MVSLRAKLLWAPLAAGWLFTAVLALLLSFQPGLFLRDSSWIALAAAQDEEDEPPVAVVIGAEGTASVLRDLGMPTERVMSPVKPGLWLYRGDQIWTGEDGWLEIQFDDAARVMVTPNSRVEVVSGLVRELDRETQRILPTLRLLLGRVYAHVAGALSRLRSFSVETPSAIAGVRGTIFAVDAGVTGRTVVSVHQGVVAVASPALPRSESLIGPGEEIHVLPGELPGSPRRLGAGEAQRWEGMAEWLDVQFQWRRSLEQGRGELILVQQAAN